MKKKLLPLAFIAAAVAALWMPFKYDEQRETRWLYPRWPSPDRFTHNMPPITIWTLNHHLVNMAVEVVREDPQWWTKFFCCLLVIAVVM